MYAWTMLCGGVLDMKTIQQIQNGRETDREEEGEGGEDRRREGKGKEREDCL